MSESAYRYVVKKRGREHAAFVYAADAKDYIESDVARDYIEASHGRDRRAVYSVEDYTIEDAESGRKVVGVSGHGYAILESLRRAGR